VGNQWDTQARTVQPRARSVAAYPANQRRRLERSGRGCRRAGAAHRRGKRTTGGGDRIQLVASRRFAKRSA